jgi:hypothetical protein
MSSFGQRRSLTWTWIMNGMCGFLFLYIKGTKICLSWYFYVPWSNPVYNSGGKCIWL